MRSSRYLIIGGDDRMVELARLMVREGYDISVFGLDKADIGEVKNHLSLDDALKNAKVVICPVPFAKEGTKINTKYAKEDIAIEDLFSRMRKGQLLLPGAMNSYGKELAAVYGIEYVDYYKDEAYQILNTIPTAEGALSIIINGTERTLFGSRVLVLGYGRIGKLLSGYLKSLGAEVYTAARKAADLAWINANAYRAVPLDELPMYLERMDIIVNTIPALILDRGMLELTSRDTFILDVASFPGGTDFEFAAEKGIKAVHALGLPGKVACKSAAAYIYEAIKKHLEAEGENMK